MELKIIARVKYKHSSIKKPESTGWQELPKSGGVGWDRGGGCVSGVRRAEGVVEPFCAVKENPSLGHLFLQGSGSWEAQDQSVGRFNC